MRRKRTVQVRISQLLWGTLVVAAFLAGRHFSDDASQTPARPQAVSVALPLQAPIAFDFASSMQGETADSEIFSFYIGLSR